MTEYSGVTKRPIPILLVAVAITLGACGVSAEPDSQGSSLSQSPTPEEIAATPLPQPSHVNEVTEDEPETPVEEDSQEPDAALIVGSIELSVESGGVEHVYAYDADHCFVSPEYILAGGAGVEEGTGIASEVGISSSPARLLDEKTGTFQAEGLISVRTQGNEIVADGRMVTPGDATIPATFTYRHDHNSAHYVVAWFSGSTQVGAGYVKVNCDY